MLHPIFDRLFGKLLRRWDRYQDAPRDPERVTELAAARMELDDVRDEIDEVRRQHHPDPEAPARPESRPIGVDVDKYEALRLRGIFPEG